MFELSSVDVRYATQELGRLVGAKIEKIFQAENKRDLFFILYTGEGKKNLRFLLPGIVCIAKEKGNYPQSPPGFAMFLRKHIDGARITAVEQAGFDRIIQFTIARKDATFTLVVELFHPGNMLLLDSEGRIINLLEAQQYKDRSLRGRQQYVPPPACIDLPKTDEEAMMRIISASTKDSIVTTLAIHLSLGGTYAEEACIRAGIAKGRNDLTQEEVVRVAKAVRSLLDEPVLPHTDTHRPYPFMMQSKEVTPTGTTFLEAIAIVAPFDLPVKTEKKERSTPQDKLRTLVKAQEEQVRRCEDEARTQQRKGELIYEQYILVKELIEIAKDARERKIPISDALKTKEEFISYNEKNGEAVIEIEDSQKSQEEKQERSDA